MKLNAEERIYGAVFGLSMFPWTGWLAIPIAINCSLLWAWGGAPGQKKIWRRGGCVIIQTAAVFVSTANPWAYAAIIPAFVFLSLGYGIPSQFPEDAGSTLGAFYYKLVRRISGCPWHYKSPCRAELYANILTRGTIMLGLWLSFAIPMWATS